MESKTIDELAKEAQRAYQKQWRKNNREKVAAINRRYWQKKAAALAVSEQGESKSDDGKKD